MEPACSTRLETSDSLRRGARMAAKGFGGGPGAGDLARSGNGEAERRS